MRKQQLPQMISKDRMDAICRIFNFSKPQRIRLEEFITELIQECQPGGLLNSPSQDRRDQMAEIETLQSNLHTILKKRYWKSESVKKEVSLATSESLHKLLNFAGMHELFPELGPYPERSNFDFGRTFDDDAFFEARDEAASMRSFLMAKGADLLQGIFRSIDVSLQNRIKIYKNSPEATGGQKKGIKSIIILNLLSLYQELKGELTTGKGDYVEFCRELLFDMGIEPSGIESAVSRAIKDLQSRAKKT